MTLSSIPLRIGAVSYLNTKPLVYGLKQRLPDAEISYDLPSRLADDLAASNLDIALIPTVEYFADPGYEIISDACIACRGPVLSVSLLSRVPMNEITSLALDEGSRTSIALVQVLLKVHHNVVPRLSSLPIGASARDVDADAVLVIGDRAMTELENDFSFHWDLGEQWCQWSDTSFVFAMWTARANARFDVSVVSHAFEEARNEGLHNLSEIAEQEAGTLGLSSSQCLSYLRDNLYFFLGDRERSGLKLFREHATSMGLVGNPV